jgi:opine dehydrogenase
MGAAFQAPFDTSGIIADILGPCSIRDRYITEDLPFSLVPMSNLGRILSVPTPLIDSLINLGCAVCDEDFWQTGRTLEKIGLAGMSSEELLNYVN